MPVSTSTRGSTAYATPVFPLTPSQASLNPMSPPSMSPPLMSSHSPTVTSVGQVVKTNVVTRIAIEGKAKQGEEGASVKMYLKLAIPVDSITPGSTVALFPEENVKILTSQVHPLDSNSVPYNFSSSTSPLLHDAARTLNLPPRLPTTFDATYHLSPSPIPTSIASTNCSTESGSVAIPPVDPYFTGQILVSGYNIAYVLPKCFPSRESGQHESEYSHSLHNKRRPSVGDRNHAHFMAAVDMWVPFVTRPPRFPYHLSIPTPRCLHNNIRLRIFPPYNTLASFASLSSLEDDSNSWDLTSDPHVTRTTSNRHARTLSYNHFADDESSDSSTSGFPNGFGIQGTFPSTDRLRIRWAKPMKSLEGAAGSRNLRRRVGVKDVKSEMLCVVRGKRQSSNNGLAGIVMDVEYKATCKGIWFPGVAILLGLDVCLVAKNADVGWLTDSPIEWNVVGGMGYTGFGITGIEQVTDQPSSKASSFDSQLSVSPEDSSLPFPNGGPREGSSTQSLLRAPLPPNNAAECFFEDPNGVMTSHLGTISSVSSLSQFATAAPPLAPLTLHINMNDVLPPNKTPFTFSIHGTILVTPKSIISRVNDNDGSSCLPDYSETTEPISLPHFTVLAADAETAKIEVKNAIEGTNATVEIYTPSGDIAKDPQTRKTVLQKGGSTRCTEGGGRIAIRTIRNRFVQPHTPASSPTSRVSQSITRPLRSLGQVRHYHSPLLIHSVKVTVTPFVSRRSLIPDVYAVRIHLSTPANNETDWLEFGLPRVDLSSCLPRVQIAAASVAGVSVQHVITNTEKQLLDNEFLPGAVYERMEGTEWVSWVKIQVGSSSGDKAVIDYIVTVEPTRSVWSSSWNKGRQWDLLLPTFTLPIERLHVKLKSVEGFKFCPIHTNLRHLHICPSSQNLLNFGQGELFTPQVSINVKSANPEKSRTWLWLSITFLSSLLILLFYQNSVSGLRIHSFDVLSKKSSSDQVTADIQGPVTTTVTISTTITEYPSNSQHTVNPTFCPVDSSLRPQSTSTTVIRLLATSSVLSTSVATTTQNTLTHRHEIPVWEKLGLDNLRLVSIPIPDFTLSSTKETLTQCGKMVWEVIEYLLFS